MHKKIFKVLSPAEKRVANARERAWAVPLSLSLSPTEAKRSVIGNNPTSLRRAAAVLICRPRTKYVQVPSDIRLLQSRRGACCRNLEMALHQEPVASQASGTHSMAAAAAGETRVGRQICWLVASGVCPPPSPFPLKYTPVAFYFPFFSVISFWEVHMRQSPH